jgi:hypothetical protein
MSDLYTYAVGELPAETHSEILQRVKEAGYTPRVVGQMPNGGDWHIKVAEVVSQADLKTAINGATIGVLSLSVSSLDIAGDGAATGAVTITDSRGAGASGKTCAVTCANGLKVSAVSIVLDGSGECTFTFGPSPLSGWISNHNVCFALTDDSVPPVALPTKFTG